MSHYKPYPAYRDSGVKWIGQVPEHWENPLEFGATHQSELNDVTLMCLPMLLMLGP